MSRKVVVRLKGGLGNQLFCYAAARRLAWYNNAELVIDTVTGFKYDDLYKRSYSLNKFGITATIATRAQQMEPLGRLRRLVARKLAQSKPLSQQRYIQQVGVEFNPAILSLRLQEGTTYFDAFGQSERYFFDIREQLQQELTMSAPDDDFNREMARKIGKCLSVAVHMRWFDAGKAAHSLNMSLSYYANAIPELLSKIGHAHFFIFSDYPERTIDLLKPLLDGKTYTVVDQNANVGNSEADFWLMCQCRHFIISNSTFAWWAAWLAECNDARTQVFAPARNLDPRQSVTAWGFPYLLPDRWTIL
jgi:Glycosyl transferase family 11